MYNNNVDKYLKMMFTIKFTKDSGIIDVDKNKD